MFRIARLSLFAVVVLGGISAYAQNTHWQGDPVGEGSWFVSDNWTSGVPSEETWAVIDNGGTARISEGLARAASLRLGVHDAGRLHLDGGSLEIEYTLDFGFHEDSHGSLSISGGTLTAGHVHISSGLGSGAVTQTGGSLTTGLLNVAGQSSVYLLFPSTPEDYGEANYHLIGGRVEATGAVVGKSGIGRFHHDGGIVAIETRLTVGGVISEQPDLHWDGVTTLPPAVRFIEPSGESSDVVNHIAANRLDAITDVWIPPPTPSEGLYELAGGQLSTRELFVDRTGIFRQTGGSHQSRYVDVGSDGRCELLGGALEVAAGLNAAGTLDFGGTSARLTAGGALLNFSKGIANAQHARIEAGANSLTIFAAGFDPDSDLGSYQTQGLTHFAGSDLVLAANQGFAGWGNVDDHVIAAGTITAAAGGFINLRGGLELKGQANLQLGGGVVSVVDDRTVIRSGNLSAAGLHVVGTVEYVPAVPVETDNGIIYYFQPPILTPGLARQLGGKVALAGDLRVDLGRYELAGGELRARAVVVGDTFSFPAVDPPATFVQSGGYAEVGTINLGVWSVFASAVTDGTALSGADWAGTPRAFIPYTIGTNSTYRLEDGTLVAERIRIGSGLSSAKANFIQTGGQIRTSHSVTIYGAQSQYTLLGGSLETPRLHVGGTSNTFQRSGTLSILDPSSEIAIAGELLLGVQTRFIATPGATIRLARPEDDDGWPPLDGNHLKIHSTSAQELSGLGNLTLVYEGGLDTLATLEVAGEDLGPGRGGFFENFALDTLQIGGEEAARVSLVDLIDNQLNSPQSEALYVKHLIVRPGSYLDLGGLNLYYMTADIAGSATVEGAMFAVASVPEPSTFGLASFAIIIGATALRRGRRR